MSIIVRGEGETPNRIFLCGERPGFEEARSGRPFVGPAGDELWDRLFRLCDLTRDDVYVTNLVKTFSKNAPSKSEIASWSSELRAELYRCKPEIIITIGYHAARWFLPQFESTNGDYFHGLYFPYTYGRLSPRTAVVVPVIHSSAALRQPDRYQLQLSTDLLAVREVLQGRRALHTARRVQPSRVGLAVYRPHDAIGVDTEFNEETGDVYVVTLSREGHEASAIELPADTSALATTLLSADRLISHMAKAEYHALAHLGIDLLTADSDVVVDDTMLKAYLLQQPQSLKVLAYRLLGYEMHEYADLIDPLDRTRVQSTLEEAYAKFNQLYDQRAKVVRRLRARYRDDGKRATEAQTLAEAAVPVPTTPDGDAIPKRALTSLKRFVGASGETHGETRGEDSSAGSDDGDEARDTPKDSLRKRWGKSTFSALVPLPPRPTWKDVPSGERLTYALTDPIAHREVDRILDPQLDARGLRKIYEIDRAVLPFLVRNEQIGVAVDAKRLKRLGAQFKDQLDANIIAIKLLVGKEINPSSAPDVSRLLFEELGITPTKPTKGGTHYTTADKYLKARRKEHDVIDLILSSRQLSKYIGTYTERLPLLLRSGRYHPDWKYTRTATGRLAEEIILLVPKHDPLAKEQGRPNRAKAIRNCFYAPEGHLLVSVDLSQIELRTMAHLSRDTRLLRAYHRGEDIHANVAHELLGAPKQKAQQDESKHRLPAKTINFGIINGMTEFGMLDQLHENGQLHWTIEDVREMLVGWFKIHSGVDTYWKQQIARAKRQGYVTTMYGRRRYIPGVLSTSDQVRREAERQCLCPIQGSADEISKIWNARIWRRIILREWRDHHYCEPWVRVHDDTTLETDTRRSSAVAQRMLDLVPQVLSIPTLAEAKTGTRWGDLHELEHVA